VCGKLPARFPTALATATAAPAPAAATAAATTATFATRASFVDGYGATEEVLAVEFLDGAESFVVIVDFDETKTTQLVGVTVTDETDVVDLKPGLREKILQVLLTGLEGQVAHVKFLHRRTPLTLAVPTAGDIYSTQGAGSGWQAVNRLATSETKPSLH